VAESEETGLSRHRELLWIGPLAALAGAAFALLYDADNGLRAVFAVKAELRQAELRVDKLWTERVALVERAERLRTDPFEIESVARESLGMVRQGEIVVRLRDDSSQGD
jgi:cell division protein FtsB